MLRNQVSPTVRIRFSVLNEVLSLNAQESASQLATLPGSWVILNEVLSLNAQE